jgi:hypothetical protein
MATESNTAPTLLNMLTCDATHRDPGSGKWFLLGLFSSISSGGFPFAFREMFVYLTIQGAQGKVPLRLQVVASDRKEEPVFKIDLEMTVAEPRVLAELVVPLRGIVFTKPGEYLIQVYANNEFLGERAIVAAITGRPGGAS